MIRMITYENEHASIQIDCSIHLLKQTWIGVPSSEHFRDSSLAALALAKRHQVKRWEIDLRQLRMFNPIDLLWFIQQWIPQASKTLTATARIAIVLNDANQFGRLGSDLLIKAFTAQNNLLSFRYFIGTTDTHFWLMSTS